DAGGLRKGSETPAGYDRIRFPIFVERKPQLHSCRTMRARAAFQLRSFGKFYSRPALACQPDLAIAQELSTRQPTPRFPPPLRAPFASARSRESGSDRFGNKALECLKKN